MDRPPLQEPPAAGVGKRGALGLAPIDTDDADGDATPQPVVEDTHSRRLSAVEPRALARTPTTPATPLPSRRSIALSARVPQSLDELEAGNAEKTARRDFGSEGSWHRDRYASYVQCVRYVHRRACSLPNVHMGCRMVALSEMSLRMDMWAKTFVYELFPTPLAFVLALLAEGATVAKNRFCAVQNDLPQHRKRPTIHTPRTKRWPKTCSVHAPTRAAIHAHKDHRRNYHGYLCQVLLACGHAGSSRHLKLGMILGYPGYY